MKNKLISCTFYILMIIPVVLVFLYGLLGLDNSGGFLEQNELIIKIVLLILSIVGSFFVIYLTYINVNLSQLNKKFTLIMSVSWIAFVILIVYFIYAFRNCCGF